MTAKVFICLKNSASSALKPAALRVLRLSIAVVSSAAILRSDLVTCNGVGLLVQLTFCTGPFVGTAC